MGIAYKCPNCGYKDFDNMPCFNCGSKMDAYETGTSLRFGNNERMYFNPSAKVVKKFGEAPNIVPDTINKFDWGAGRYFQTRTEQNKYYKENGLMKVSKAELRRKNNSERHRPTQMVSYPGQTSRISTAERTKDMD